MARINKMTDGVFIDIVGMENQISAYDIFMREDSSDADLNLFLGKYRNFIIKNKTEFERMSRIEEIIMQIRAKENLDDVRLSLVREYIYARCPFYRRNKIAKDIRIIVDNVEFWSNDLDSLMNNKEFMDKAKKKLVKAMEKEIGENISSYKMIYSKG